MDPAQRPKWWAGVLLVLPLAVGAFTVVGTIFASRGQPDARPLDVLGIALLLVGPAALGYDEHGLTVQIDDDGLGAATALRSGGSRAAGSAGGGNGLPGMRERTQALGGRSQLGAVPMAGSGSAPSFPWPSVWPLQRMRPSGDRCPACR
jgi:hypothetical protein